MPARHNETYEADTRTSEEMVANYRRALETEGGDASLALVHYRGGLKEFSLGERYAGSADPLDRVTGSTILGQLGWGDDCYHEESVAILLNLLADGDERVLEAAAYALGHRRSERSIPRILPLATHPNPSVRLASVSGLSGQDHPEAIDALIALAHDEDRDVRNWASFGLGGMTDVDTPKLREALARLLDEEDHEIRGEALIGLAKRSDPRALPAVVRELNGPFWGSWCLEAAEMLADPLLLSLITRLRERTALEVMVTFANDFRDAIEACTR